MKLLVCGGRDFNDYQSLDNTLTFLNGMIGIDIIISGGAPGADTMAKNWAHHNGIHCAEVKALWNSFGKSAGYKRNSTMLLLKPDLCLAMPGGKGTDMMVKLCHNKNISVKDMRN